jgi:hypothetical protein
MVVGDGEIALAKAAAFVRVLLKRQLLSKDGANRETVAGRPLTPNSERWSWRLKA